MTYQVPNASKSDAGVQTMMFFGDSEVGICDNSLNITSIATVGTVATATLAAAWPSNWYGDAFYMTGWNQVEYNGFHSCTRIDDQHFKFTVPSGTVTPGTARTGISPVCNVHSGFKRNGAMHVVNARLGAPFRMLANLGAPGERASQIADDVNYLLFARPTWVYCAFGANDLFVTSNVATAATATQALLTRILTGGSKVIYQSLTPVTAAATAYQGGNYNKRACQFNQQMREWAQLQPNLIYFDAFSALVDPLSTTAVPIANTMIADGAHYSVYGAELLAYALKPIIKPLVSPVNWLPSTVADYTENDGNSRNYCPNALFTNAAGGTLSGGAVGTGAGSLTINATGSGSAPVATCSVVARTLVDNGDVAGNSQRVVYQAGNGVENQLTISADIPITLLSANDYVYAACAVDIKSVTGAKMYIAGMYLLITIAGDEQWVACMKAGHDWTFTFDPRTAITADVHEVWKSPVVHLAVIPDSIVMRCWFYNSTSGGTYTVDVGRWGFWKQYGTNIADIGPIAPAAP